MPDLKTFITTSAELIAILGAISGSIFFFATIGIKKDLEQKLEQDSRALKDLIAANEAADKLRSERIKSKIIHLTVEINVLAQKIADIEGYLESPSDSPRCFAVRGSINTAKIVPEEDTRW